MTPNRLLRSAADAQADRYDDVRVYDRDAGTGWYVSDVVYEAVQDDETVRELAEAASQAAVAARAACDAEADDVQRSAETAEGELLSALHRRAEQVAEAEADRLLSDDDDAEGVAA